MNRITTVAVALIVAAGLTTMVYAVPGTTQRALAWGGGFGGCGWGGFGGCGWGGFGGCGWGGFGGCGWGCGWGCGGCGIGCGSWDGWVD